MQLRSALIFIVTFFVSLCSIVYELIYSQLLTVIFGGTVLRYSITIGLYLFCLGIGSFLYNYIAKYDKKKSFVLVEMGLSIVGFFGVIFIIGLNSYFGFLPHIVKVVLSNIPVVLIGILSGLDLPLLSFFAGEKSSAYSQVLGVDYFGSLIGTVAYSLLFYPSYGLIFSAAVIAFINLLVSLALFIFLYKKKSISFTISFFILISAFIFVLVNISSVSDYLMKLYLSQSIISFYDSWTIGDLFVNVKDVFFTPYQMVFLYSLVLNPGSQYELKNTCLNIDEHIQLCDSWVHEYHAGLVDVPMAFFENVTNNTRVLLIGGGDGIAVNYLKKYGVQIDQVDIDEKFVNYGKNSEFISKYQNNSFDYPLLNLIIDDGFTYARNTKNKYDLVILDLPGLKEDKMLPLYSKEFFTAIKDTLNEKGIIITWIYSFEENPDYSEVLMNTLSSTNLSYFIEYESYRLSDDARFPVENYLLVSNDNTRQLNFSKNEYVAQFYKKYKDLLWQELNFNNSLPVNSVFKPSYKMIIKNEGQ